MNDRPGRARQSRQTGLPLPGAGSRPLAWERSICEPRRPRASQGREHHHTRRRSQCQSWSRLYRDRSCTL